jgi:hypothetical protein
LKQSSDLQITILTHYYPYSKSRISVWKSPEKHVVHRFLFACEEQSLFSLFCDRSVPVLCSLNLPFTKRYVSYYTIPLLRQRFGPHWHEGREHMASSPRMAPLAAEYHCHAAAWRNQRHQAQHPFHPHGLDGRANAITLLGCQVAASTATGSSRGQLPVELHRCV